MGKLLSNYIPNKKNNVLDKYLNAGEFNNNNINKNNSVTSSFSSNPPTTWGVGNKYVPSTKIIYNGSPSAADVVGDYKAKYLQDYEKLLQSKYGLNNYDVNKSWGEQVGIPLSDWNSNETNESNALLQYLTLQEQLGLGEGLNTKYNEFNKYKQQAMGEQGVIKEQGEKYIDTQNKINGINDTGISESSKVGLLNNYMGKTATIDNYVQDKKDTALSEYQTNINTSNKELASGKYNILSEYQDTLYNDAKAVLDSSFNAEDMNKYLASIKDKVSPTQYLNLENYAKGLQSNPAWLEAINNATQTDGYLINGKRYTNEALKYTTNYLLSELGSDIQYPYIDSVVKKIVIRKGELTDEDINSLVSDKLSKEDIKLIQSTFLSLLE